MSEASPTVLPQTKRSPAPFIVGSPRSGTTLLRLMLDAHPDLAIPAETHFIGTVARAWADGGDDAVGAALEVMIRDPHWADFGVDHRVLRRRCEEAAPTSAGALLRLFYTTYAAKHGKSRWGDKTTSYTSTMSAILDLLPEARFIHIIRDGRDAALSVLPLWFGPDSIEDAAHWWVRHVSAALRDAVTVPYLEVRFEHLVADPVPVLERICNFVGLAYSPEMLNYSMRARARQRELADLKTARGVIPAAERTRNSPLLAHSPDASRAGRWRTEMPREDCQRFEAIAGTLLEQLGYPLG